jgi:hypothetical protein
MGKNRLYYAHSKRDYGSNREYRDLLYLKGRFTKAEVICPNNDLGELGSMKPYLDFVDTCLTVIVREYGGFIGKGVFHEVARALSNQIQIWAIDEKERGKFILTEVAGLHRVSPGNVYVKYGKLIYYEQIKNKNYEN